MTAPAPDVDALIERIRALADVLYWANVEWRIPGDATQKIGKLAVKAADALAQMRERIAELERMDSEAAEYVESVICMRTHFTGNPPYVGWKGLGLALTETLDRAERAEAGYREQGERAALADIRAESAEARAERLAAALRELIGIIEIAAVVPDAIKKTLLIAWDDPALERARAALAGEDGK